MTDPDHIVFKGVYLAQAGLGLGKQLLDGAKSRATRLQLGTFQPNLKEQHGYACEGFGEVRRTDGDTEKGSPDILLRWRR